MSFFDPGKTRVNWTPTPLRGSARPERGCVQCGSALEMSERGQYDSSGKCFNCANWVSEEDETVEDLEG